MHHIYSLYAYLVILIVLLPFTLIVSLIPGLGVRRRMAHRTGRVLFVLLGFKIDVHGISNIPDKTSIVIANHASYLDGIILTAALPPKFTFVIKREVTSVPFLHLLLRKMGSHFVERTNRKEAANHLIKMIRMAEQGESLAIFPEGTFRKEAGLRTFQKGAFAVAHKTNLPLIPVFIHGARKALPAEEWKLTRQTIKVQIMPGLDNTGDYPNVTELKSNVERMFSQEVGHI